MYVTLAGSPLKPPPVWVTEIVLTPVEAGVYVNVWVRLSVIVRLVGLNVPPPPPALARC